MTAENLIASVTGKIKNMAPVGITPDATVLLSQLTQRQARLRDKAELTASHTELQEAAQRGELVCWNTCKLRDENGHRVFTRGEAMPVVDVQSALLLPDRRLVTTRPRWEAAQEYRRLAGYLQAEERVQITARLKHATAKQDAASAEIARLQEALATERQKKAEAEKAVASAEAELRRFVERAPV